MIHFCQLNPWVRWHPIGGQLPKKDPKCWNTKDRFSIYHIFCNFGLKHKVWIENVFFRKLFLNTDKVKLLTKQRVNYTPNIRLGGESVEGQPLWGCPFDGKLCPSMSGVSVILHESRQAKICHLHQVVRAHQAVPGSQVSATKKQDVFILTNKSQNVNIVIKCICISYSISVLIYRWNKCIHYYT